MLQRNQTKIKTKMPSSLRKCTRYQGRFAPQQFKFISETCRLSTLEKEMKECQAENKELRNKVKILEDFVTSHIAADVPTTIDTPVPDASSTYDTVTSTSVSTSHVSLPLPPTLEYGSTSNTFIPVRNGVQIKPKMIVPIETQNSFSPLADLVDEPEDSIIVGDSMIRHQLEEFCGRAPKRRKRYCYPGAKIDDITKALEDITAKEKHDSLYIVHVGTNDVKNTNSEELLEKYKRLIGTLKEKRSKFIVSGFLPRIGAENKFYNKAFSTNDRLKSLCSKENVEFLNLWNHFNDQWILFNHDGLHLNPVGSARLGRLLSDAVEAHRTKTGEQRGLVTLSHKQEKKHLFKGSN